MAIRVRRISSRGASILFLASVLASALVLFSMLPAMAEFAPPAIDTAPPGAAKEGAVAHGARLAAESRERQRELHDPRDSALEERQFYPGYGYDFPGFRDLLFGQGRRSPARNKQSLLTSLSVPARTARTERRYCRSTVRANRGRL